MRELLKDLCELDGVSGFEDEVCLFIKRRILPFVDHVNVDALGNLLAFKKGRKPRVRPCIVSAHMDEVGFLVKGFTDKGELTIVPVGAIDPRVVVGRRVRIGDKRIPGAIGLKAIHLTTEEERSIAPGFDQLHIDIGAPTKDDAEGLVRVADPVTFDSRFIPMGEGCVKAKALDDRAGCAVMITMLEAELEYDTWFAFTTNGEIGYRGASVVARRLDPGVCIVLDGTAAGDLPEVDPHLHGTGLRKGAALSFMDRGTIYSRRLVKSLTEAATDRGIRWQYKQMVSDLTDASTLERGASGAQTITLSVPVRNIRSASSIICLSDLDELSKLAVLAIREAGDCDV